jgi:hypothetical protein
MTSPQQQQQYDTHFNQKFYYCIHCSSTTENSEMKPCAIRALLFIPPHRKMVVGEKGEIEFCFSVELNSIAASTLSDR